MSKHDLFLESIKLRRKILISVNSIEKGIIKRDCIPFDFGPSKRFHDTRNRYHFYDLNSPDGSHVLSILPEQLLEIDILDEVFVPSDYVTWRPTRWFIKRDWDECS